MPIQQTPSLFNSHPLSHHQNHHPITSTSESTHKMNSDTSPKKRKVAPHDKISPPPSFSHTSPNLRQRLPTSASPNPSEPSSRPSGRRTRVAIWREWCKKWEVPRKLLHSSIGFITLNLYKSDANAVLIAVHLSKALVVIWIADMLRFRSRRFSAFYESVLGFLMRESEKHNWNGVLFYLIGVIISLTTLPQDISVLSILILSWVDTAASVVGRLYGPLTPSLPSPPFARRKSLAGFLGAFVTGTLTSSLYWSLYAGTAPGPYSWTGVVARGNGTARGSVLDYLLDHSTLQLTGQLPNPRSTMGLASLSVGCGLVGAIGEALDVFEWDDNMVLPILSGWSIWGMMKLLG